MSKFFICSHCGNVIGKVIDKGVPLMCCGVKMQELVPNTVEASTEKHLPTVNVDGNTIKVKVGSVAHPMTDEHHISFVYLETNAGGQRKNLSGAPETEFALSSGEKPIAVYAYCNLHGLWKVAL